MAGCFRRSRPVIETVASRGMGRWRAIVLCALLMIPGLALAQNPSGPLEKVRLQLKWKHQFQFAGYYAAKEKGFYAEEGLDVDLFELPPGAAPVGVLLAGGADYGVGDAGLIIDREQGAPAVVLAQIFQHSPTVLVTMRESGIADPEKLAGKRIMGDLAGSGYVPLRAMLLQALGDGSKFTVAPYAHGLADLISGDVDALAAYLGNEPYLLKHQGVSFNILNPRDFGIDFYGDNLFTTESEVQAHPERVDRMIRASVKGWEYALAHTDELVDLISQKYSSERTKEHLAFEAKMTEMAVLPDLMPIGSLRAERYEKTAKTLSALGMMKKDVVPEGFLYPGAPGRTAAAGTVGLRISLSAEEQAWVASQPEVEMAYCDLAPYQFTGEGLPTGYQVEIMDAVLSLAGLTANYIEAKPDEVLPGIRDGRFDVALHIQDSPETASSFLFSDRHIDVVQAVFGGSASSEVADLTGLRGKKVAWCAAPGSESRLAMFLPESTLLQADSVEEMFRRISSGEADYCVQEIRSGEYALQKGSITNIEVKGIFRVPGESFGKAYEYGVRQDLPVLKSILSKAYRALSPAERQRIWNKWLVSEEGKLAAGARVTLSEEERLWLLEHPSIRAGLPLDYPGVSFKGDDGAMQGILVDYLKLAGERTGINFTVQYLNWPDLVSSSKARTLDLFSGVKPLDSNETACSSKAFMSFFYVIVTRQEVPFVPGRSWLEGKRVVVLQSSAAQHFLEAEGQDTQVIHAGNVREALALVNYGQADAYVGDSVTASYAIAHQYLGNLKIAAPAGYPDQPVVYVVRKDWPELASILDKAIDSITPEEHDAIFRHWLAVRFEQPVGWSRILKWVAATAGSLLLLLLLALLWNRQLRRVVAAQTSELAAEKEHLRESEERLSYTLDATNDGVWDWNLVTNAVYWSPHAFEMLGYAPTDFEVNPDTWRERIHPDDASHWDAVIAGAVRDGEPFSVEARYHRKDGGWQWTLVRGQRVACDAAGQPLRMVGTHLDLTERKRAEAERERLMSAIEQAAESIVITDTDGKIQYVNPAFERISGYTREEAVGNNPRFLKSGMHDDSFYQAMWATLQTGEPWFGRITNEKKDGTLYTEEAAISPVRDASGRTVNYVAVKRDITAEMRLEGQLRQSQKMEAIGTLAGGIAHDFNNILSAILGYAQLAGDDLDDTPHLLEDISEIAKAGNRAKDLVAQILTFTRQSDHEMRPLRLDPVVKEATKLLRATIPSTIEIRVEADPHCGLVMADASQIHQVLMNLCTNAYHAMRETGGTLTVDLRQRELSEEEAESHLDLRPDSYAVLVVSDTGFGMDKGTQERIFDPYFTTKEKGEGTGLGLAVVHNIVKAHGGVITVYSEANVGTTFRVYFPICRAAGAVVEESLPAEKPLGSARVLYVDDEATNRALVLNSLSRFGYRVTVSDSAVEAFDLCKADPRAFDVIVTDLTMPKMTGIELAREVRRLSPELPVILCSGFHDAASAEQAKEAKVSDFLHKPIDPMQLGWAIRRALEYDGE